MKKYLAFLFVFSLLLGQTYILKNDVLDDGGTKMTSPSYILRGSFGQPTIGKINNPSYNAYLGFWNPYYFPAIPPPPAAWAKRTDILSNVSGKGVKDGGALVGTDNAVYGFRGNKSPEFYKYTGTWRAKETIPFGYKPGTSDINKKKVGKGGALCWDEANTIYATKGAGTREFWAYDISANTWTAKAFVTVPKALKGGTSLAFKDGKVYLLAGGQKAADLTNFYVYDVAGNSWTSLERAPLGPATKVYKDGSCLALIGTKFYCLKGGAKVNEFYNYTIGGTWSTYPGDTLPLNHPSLPGKKNKVKAGGAMTVLHNKIYAIKGGGSNEFWKYTPGTGTWDDIDDTIPKGALGKKGTPKSGAALAFLQDTIYLLKGNNTQEFWRYGPVVSKGEIVRVAEPTTYSALMTEKTITTAQFSFDVIPNPFTKFAIIRYTVPVAGKVSIKLYNTTGRLVQTIADEYHNAGNYTLEIDNCPIRVSDNLNSYFGYPIRVRGVYFLRYESTTQTKEIKLIVE